MTQIPLFEPRASWTAPTLSELPSWKGAERVCIDIETRDPDLKATGPGVRRGAYIVGVSFAIQDGPDHERWPCYYLPIRHEAGGNLPIEAVLAYLRQQAADYRGPGTIIAGCNLGPYDLDFLEEAGVHFEPERFRDVTIAEPLLDENQFQYGLDAVAERYRIDGKQETELMRAAAAYGWCDPSRVKQHLWQLPARHVGPYAEQDARLPLRILMLQEHELAKPQYEGHSLWPIYELESQLIPVLLRMKRVGVAIDERRLEYVEAQGQRKEVEYMREFSRLIGTELTPDDINKNALIGRTLVDALGVKLPLTKTKQYSVKADVLKSIDHPAVHALLRAKAWNKMRTTYVNQVLAHLTNGRLHCTFNQLKREKEDGGAGGTVSGRLSAANPSLQNQPARDEEIGPLWRSIYVPDEGGEWAVSDFSQQEPRWTVHFAAETNRIGAHEARERYRRDPNTDFHDLVAEITGVGRKRAKAIGLGLSYNMGEAKLCRQLGLDTVWVKHWRTGRMIERAGPEGKSILEQFDSRMPFIRQLAELTRDRADERGWIRTVLGRICRFPAAENRPGFEWTSKALNRLIQGSSGDQTKKAMLDADAAGLRVQLQVHDELDMTIWSRDEAEALAEIMRTCVPCTVPAKVDIETGPNWGDIS